MQESTFSFGKLPNSKVDRISNNVTICLTEECNLRCKYCYMTSKNSFKKLNFEVAKKAVDYILNARDIYSLDSVVWDFIGGEPLLEIDLMDKICDYIKKRMYELNHPWFNDYMISFATNGILYHTKKVQDFIKKNRLHLSIGISIDGNKIKHNMQRVYADGRGSYDDVVKNVPLWLKQFGQSAYTKSTFAHDDLMYLKDSVIHLWNIGVKKVVANVVFEDVWKPHDADVFEQQLKSLADYIIENDIWRDNDYTLRFFDPSIGFPLREDQKDQFGCGSGKMVAVDCEGKLYPCIRFLDFSLNNQPAFCIGDVFNGISKDKLKPFSFLTKRTSDPEKCKNCKVASGCMSCVGHDYDASSGGTIFKRTTFNCEMHKANVRACEYFWNEVDKHLLPGELNPRKIEQFRYEKFSGKSLIIYTEDDAIPYCCYSKNNNLGRKMSPEILKKSISFAKNNNLEAIFVVDSYLSNDYKDYKKYGVVQNLCSANDKINKSIVSLPIEPHDIKNLYQNVKTIAGNKVDRINIILKNVQDLKDTDLLDYKEELTLIANYIEKENPELKVNVLSDLFSLKGKNNGCGAGTTTYTVAPNGKLYICPGFYFEDEDRFAIGDLNNGFSFDYKTSLYKCNSIECAACRNWHCKRCLYLNKKFTNEYTISPDIQCKISEIEKEVASRLYSNLHKVVEK